MTFSAVPLSRLMAKIFSYWLAFLCLITSSIAGATCIGDTSAKHPYSFYVVPQFSATDFYTAWAPFLEKVGLQTKQCFNLIIPSTIPEFERAVISGQADYAYMNPYHQVIAYHAKKYTPLIADGDKKLSGIVVVKANSPIKTLADLKNATIAFPSPNAFGASLLIRASLTKAGIPFRAEYVKSHSNVYRAVIFGDYQAGGGIMATLERERPEVRGNLRIVFTTGSYRPHPIAVNPRVGPADVSAFTNAILELKNNPNDAQLLAKIQIADPIKVNYSDDYKPLESLGLGKFVVLDAN